MNPVFRISGLRKKVGDRDLLDIDQLQLDRGKCYLLVGENGVGKTTLLRILAGLETADAGNFEFDGTNCNKAAERSLLAPRLIYVHQHSYLFNSSVAENIAFGLRRMGMPRQERLERVKLEMAWAGVSHLAEVPPNRLSGGEKQRVALARARVLHPELLLLDEPTANLDDSARMQVAEIIRNMRDSNNCLLIATHDHDLIRLDNVITMKLEGGRISLPPRQ